MILPGDSRFGAVEGRFVTANAVGFACGYIVMVTKLFKFGATLAIGFSVVGVLVFGSQLGSYVSTSANCVQESVQSAVPMEFELRRARDLVNQIVPELRANIRTIAREEIEVERLEREVAKADSDLLKRRQSVAALKGDFEVVQVSYDLNGHNVSRQQLAERLASQFEQYKRAKSIVTSKRQLLDTRRKSLQSAQLLLERTRTKKADLEQQIEGLVAQHRLMKAQATQSGFEVDDSQLAKAEKLMSELSTRLETARRVLEHEADFMTDGEIPVHVELQDENDLLSEIEEHLGGSDSDSTT